MDIYHNCVSIADRLGRRQTVKRRLRYNSASWRASWSRPSPFFFLLVGAFEALSAQQTPVQTAQTRAASTRTPSKQLDREPLHRIWDLENDLLFAGVPPGARGLDYSSTLNLRRRGRQEILLTDQIVDNHALFAGIEASGVAASVGLSYLFHRTGHHKLERWVSVVHIGVATGGAIRNYGLKTFHDQLKSRRHPHTPT